MSVPCRGKESADSHVTRRMVHHASWTEIQLSASSDRLAHVELFLGWTPLQNTNSTSIDSSLYSKIDVRILA